MVLAPTRGWQIAIFVFVVLCFFSITSLVGMCARYMQYVYWKARKEEGKAGPKPSAVLADEDDMF